MLTLNKILLLSLCGRDKEQEDPSYLHLFLASLKKYVIPFYDTKVILLDTSDIEDVSKSRTQELINDYGLEQIVDLRTIYMFGLPDESVQFLERAHWSGKIGMHMNLLMDYARKKDFYDAEWIIHTDTDIEFLDDFNTKLEGFSGLLDTNPEMIISLVGDAYYNNIRYKGTEFKFVGPKRVDLYDVDTLSMYCSHMTVDVARGRDHYKTNLDNVVLNVHQQKIRNDFVCLSREYASRWGHVLNWVACGYPDKLKPVDGSLNEDQKELRGWYEEFIDDTFILRINMDKGGWIQYLLKEGNEPGFCDVTSIQLPPYSTMAKHYSSGWLMGDHFLSRSANTLQDKFSEYKTIWEKDLVAYLS